MNTPTEYTLEALRKMQVSELESLIESASEALETLRMSEWQRSVYQMLIINTKTVLAEKEKPK